MLGSLYWDSENLKDSIIAFRKATEIKLDSKKASLGLFHTLWESDKLEEAIDEMQRFMQVAQCDDYDNISKELQEKGYF